MRKGISTFVSFVILILIGVTTVTLVIAVGKPTVDRAIETANINEATQNLKILDNAIKEVASEGVGSHRAITLQVSDGDYRVINASGNFTGAIEFKREMQYSPYTPITFIKDGDLKIAVGFNSVGLAGYWNFNENTGSTVADSSMYENNGTLTNMNTTGNSTSGWTANGKFGNAMFLDGVNDYVTIADTGGLNITNNITIDAWVNFNNLNTDGQEIFNKHDNVYSVTYWIANNGQLSFYFTNSSGVQEFVVLNLKNLVATGEWHHYAFVYTGSEVRIYVDAVLRNSTLSGGSISMSSGTFRIGAYDSNRYFNGTIDEVKIYSRPLSADEVKENYEAKQSGYQAALEYKKLKIMGPERFSRGTQKICIDKMGVENNKAVVKAKLC